MGLKFVSFIVLITALVIGIFVNLLKEKGYHSHKDWIGFVYQISKNDGKVHLFVEALNKELDEVTFKCQYNESLQLTQVTLTRDPINPKYRFAYKFSNVPDDAGIHCSICGTIYLPNFSTCQQVDIVHEIPVRAPVSISEEDKEDKAEEEEKQLKRLQTQQPRPDHGDILKRLMGNRKAYISLTVSPARLDKVHRVIEILDLQYIDQVLVVLSKTFGRKKKTYGPIPESLRKLNKVKILESSIDFGPATKILPAIQYVRQIRGEIGLDDIIITVDDDTGYPRSFVTELLIACLSTDAVVSGSGMPVQFWGVYGFGLNQTRRNNYETYSLQSMANQPWYQFEKHFYYYLDAFWEHAAYIDVIEGFGGVAYRNGHIDLDLISWIIISGDEYPEFYTCFLGDDFVISYILAYGGTDRIMVRNQYYSRWDIYSFPYGFKEDALHRDLGTSNGKIVDANADKNKKCHDGIFHHFIDQETMEIKLREHILPAEFVRKFHDRFKIIEK